MSAHHAEQDESYFVSMTDLMVGMLFVFIILLMAFALNLKEQETKLTQLDHAREEMLRDIETALKNKGIPVTVLPESGVLRLPEQVLFDVNKAELQPEGLIAIGKLGEALDEILPCYAGDLEKPTCKGKAFGRLESVFVEGHTDDTGSPARNWQLSYQRARAVYIQLQETWPNLGEIRNDKNGQMGAGEKLIGVSGYADQRPINCTEGKDACRKLNRRIDMRFIMAVPNPQRQSQIDNALDPLPDVR
jgi:chemotaxis protein MotB